MALFKCKMCGGALEINGGETVVTCEYCGTQQTLPKLDDDRRANLYDRANHFRRNNEFDKAMGIYEQILNEDNTDAEAYWSIVLCRYGIEYVEDPSSHKRVPTVNRAQFTSVFDDDNYKSALQYADSYQRSIYEEEAKAINEIQKGILAISQKEEPFDVFICYKETDNNGRRTPDSVLANDLYHQLIQEGFKVFFSRITLEDKLGSAYEPYIFAALNSSKVMVVLGTRPEYFKAVWVRNEWSRYLSLIKQGQKKMLIPAYKDMDPYDLPDEFSHLQAQDMSKLGFMQDLIRGIKKILQTDEPKATVVKETVVTTGNTNTAPLLKRAFMFLEDGDWESADEYCEKVLDIDPENAQAYVGKLCAACNYHKLSEMAEDNLRWGGKSAEDITTLQLHEIRRLAQTEKIQAIKLVQRVTGMDLAESKRAIESLQPTMNEQQVRKCLQLPMATSARGYYEKAVRFGDDNLKKELQGYIASIKNRNLTAAYNDAVRAMEFASNEYDYKEAAQKFETISDFKDAKELAAECYKKAEEARLNALYDDAKSAMESATAEHEYKDAASKFEAIGEYRDSAALAKDCHEKAEVARKKRDEEIEAQRKDGILAIAKSKMTGEFVKDYEDTIRLLEPIAGWRDSLDLIGACKQKIEEIHAKEEADRLERERRMEIARVNAIKRKKRTKKILTIVSIVAILIIAAALFINFWLLPFLQYNDAVTMIEGGNYTEAKTSLTELDGFGKSEQQLLLIGGIETILNENFNEGIGEVLSAGFPVTVTYSTEGGTVPQGSVTYSTAGEFQGVSNAEKDGYRFVGWTSPTVSYEAETPLSLVLTAVWSDIFLIDYELNGGKVRNPAEYRNDGKTTQLNDPTKDGYTFIGWTGTNLNTPAKNYSIPAGTYGNLSYIANWEANTYTITFELSGGEMDKTSMDVTYDSPFSLPTPTRNGYTFGGWYNGSNEVKSGTWKKTSHIVLSAKWNAIQYKITYNLDGGKNASQNPATYTVESGTVTLQSPTKNGYKFLGWYSDKEFKSKVTKINPTDCKDIVLYAKWELGTYTVKYDAKGGAISGTPKTSFTINDLPLSLPSVSKNGCNFLGWYNGSTKVTSLNTAADVTLTAKWDPIKRKITYNLNGGKNASDNPTTYHVESGTITLKDPTRNGYKFLGWYSDSSFNNKVTQLYGKDAKDITLYAKWEVITYTITYQLNGGTLPSSAKKTFTINDLPMTLQAPTKNNYAFLGWTLNDINGASIATITDCKNYTLYASYMDVYLQMQKYEPYSWSNEKPYYIVYKYSGTATTVDIPKEYEGLPVKEIGDNAFSGNTTITTINIPDTITEIGYKAFSGCSSLKNITLPSGLTSIGGSAFNSCKSLVSISIPSGVTSIGSNAFASCTSLQSVQLPNKLKTLGVYAFEKCTSLQSINIPGTVAELQYNTFAGCTNLSTVVLNEGLQRISFNVFTSEKITKIIIPKSVTYISSDAFEGEYSYYSGTTPDCSNVTFYCRASVMPAGWQSGWNIDRPIVWGYTGN